MTRKCTKNKDFSLEIRELRYFMYCCLNMFLLMLEIALVLNFEAFPPKICQ